jgi:hypothetical protein
MSERTRSFFYAACIVLVFFLLLLIIWLVYSYKIHKLEKEDAKTTVMVYHTQNVKNIN